MTTQIEAKQQTRHTPAPWVVDEVSDGVCYVVAKDIALVATLDPSDDDAPARANAELIVKAVNAHERLVGAIKDEAARQAYAAGLGVSEWEAFLWPSARAALAEVQGE